MGQDDPNNPKDEPEDRESQPSQVPPQSVDEATALDPELLRRSKVSPHLWAMAMDWERRRREDAESGETQRESSTVPLVNVLIELKEPDTRELEAAGIDFQHFFDLFYSADVPLDQLDDLADLESILRVHHEPKSKPALDDSIPEIRASTVRNPQHPFSGTNKFTGAGVMIGIIDSGINILHPVFRRIDDPTKTRIAAILDQTQTPPVSFTRSQIEAAIATQSQLIQPGTTGNDDHTHGTHVAGIAAGNGKKAEYCTGEFKYVGVAPEAGLVIVKHNFNGPLSLRAAIDFIVDKARNAAVLPSGAPAVSGVPAVINISFGSTFGPHDGTDPQDLMIDNFLSARTTLPPPVLPVVIVACAGNESGEAPEGRPRRGGENSHAAGTIPPGGVVKSLRFDVFPELPHAGQIVGCQAEIRFVGANGLGCRLIPFGNNITNGTNVALSDGPQVGFDEATNNSHCSIIPQPIPGAAAGSRRILITIASSAGNINLPGEWTIELTNAGVAPIPYHAWIEGQQFERFKDDLSRASTINSPGSSASIITVGSYASSGKDKGRLADSSSRGPLLPPPGPGPATSRQKPDLTAPGVDISSAKYDFNMGCCCDCCCESYTPMSGTSQATPHVVGAIALMLERNPGLTHAQIKTILTTNPFTRQDSFTGTTPNNEFGFGKLDVLALLNHPLVKGSGPTISSSTARAAAATVKDVAPQLPKVPQLEEGTPLWRLLNTVEGQRLYERGRTHWDEVRTIVNTQKRVATVWHRNHGPLIMHHATRTAMLPHVPLPRELDGIELSVRAAKLVTALEPYSSKELVKALHETLPLIAQLQGKTLLELVEFFEANEKPEASELEPSEEMQHA